MACVPSVHKTVSPMAKTILPAGRVMRIEDGAGTVRAGDTGTIAAEAADPAVLVGDTGAGDTGFGTIASEAAGPAEETTSLEEASSKTM